MTFGQAGTRRVFRLRLARAAIPSAPRPTSSIVRVPGSGTLDPIAIAPSDGLIAPVL